MAISIAGAVIGREVSEKEHAEFIDSFIDSVGE
jgi:F0F1-type ATP synthase membrane subunit b/b'